MALTADQQRRCDEIVEQALALDAGRCEAFIADACPDDEEVRREATAVLAVDPQLTAIFHDSPDSAMLPLQLGRYQTEATIGRGGMSMVYRARDPVINRSVAVKVMLCGSEASADEYRRFLSELHLLGSLHHPNIVQVFDAGEHDGSPFIVMEYLQGETLADAIAHQHCTDFSLRLDIARQLAAALQRVHAAAVCHRDLKPANVFLEPDGRVKLMDFGISARMDGPRLTQTGALIGTLPYLAPEQIRGEKIGPSVDIYAFGILLFEMFTGSRPFSGTAAEILYQIVNEPLPTKPLATLPPRLVDLIRRSAAKKPADRPRNMAELLQSLNQLPNEQAPASGFGKRERIALGAAACVSLVAAGGIWIATGSRSRVKESFTQVASAVADRASEPPQPALPEPEVKSPVSPPKAEKTTDVVTPKPVKSESIASTPKQNEQHVRPQPAVRPPENGSLSSSAVHDSPGPQLLPPEPVAPPVPKAQPAQVALLPPALVVPGPPDFKAADTSTRETPKASSRAVIEEGRGADLRNIREVLKRLGEAYRTANIKELQVVRTLQPSELSTLSQSLSAQSYLDYRVEPESDPEVNGDTATVRCKRTTVMLSARAALQKQSPKTESSQVTVSLIRTGGSWKVKSVAESPKSR